MASRCQIIGVVVFVALVACISPLAAFLSHKSAAESDGSGVTDDPTPLDPTWFVTRKQWWAVKPNNVTPLTKPQRRVIIAHTSTEQCHNRDTCSTIVRNIQMDHMTRFDDIAYNFLVGGDGRVYEGRGWGVLGAHTPTCNTNCLGVGFIGNYESKHSNAKPTDNQVKYLQRLLDIGEKGGYLIANYTIIPQCQATNTQSPGDNLYNEIITWPRYSANDGGFSYVCHFD